MGFQTGLAEFFQVTRIVDLERGRPVLSTFEISEKLSLLDLSGTFVTLIGASAVINSGPRPKSRRWARLLYEAYPGCQGFYHLSNEPGRAGSSAF